MPAFFCKTPSTPIRPTLSQRRQILEPRSANWSSSWMRRSLLPQCKRAVLHRFVAAVASVAPEAAGTPVFMIEAAATVVKAFLQAGILSLVLIALILFVALRRWIDVALTLVPLLVAIVVTLEICVLIGLRLNFANIIALPLLLGIGVAFKIYYLIAWRAGETNFLQSSLTRAIF